MDMKDRLEPPRGASPEGDLDREIIIGRLATALEPLTYVHALWEGGAAAFGRLDQWSDIDLYVDVDDVSVEDAARVTEEALAYLAPIELKYLPPVPPPGNYLHLVYRLEGTPKCLLIDIAVVRHSSPDKFLEPEIHGRSRFLFNKGGAIVCPPADRAKLAAAMRASLAKTRLRFDLLSGFVAKELARGNYVEALDIYTRLVLGSLVEALRARHDPVRYNFGPRYLRYHLPAEAVAKLEDLYFVRNPKDLEAKCARAEAWYRSLGADLPSRPEV
jgi:predicted nucleotidyltransferase